MAAMELELEASTVEKARALLQGALAGNKSEEALKICEDFELEVCAFPAFLLCPDDCAASLR